MAVKKPNVESAKKTPSRSKTQAASPAKKKPIRAPAAKKRATPAAKPASRTATKKPASRPAAKSSAKRPASPKKTASPKAAPPPASPEDREARVVQAAKKVLDDLAANKNVVRTKKATQELASQLYERAESVVKDAASASSKKMGKARKATRRKAYNFVKSAVKFLEGIESRIEEKPAPAKAIGKKPAKPAVAKGTTKGTAKRNPAKTRTTKKV